MQTHPCPHTHSIFPHAHTLWSRAGAPVFSHTCILVFLHTYHLVSPHTHMHTLRVLTYTSCSHMHTSCVLTCEHPCFHTHTHTRRCPAPEEMLPVPSPPAPQAQPPGGAAAAVPGLRTPGTEQGGGSLPPPTAAPTAPPPWDAADTPHPCKPTDQAGRWEGRGPAQVDPGLLEERPPTGFEAAWPLCRAQSVEVRKAWRKVSR